MKRVLALALLAFLIISCDKTASTGKNEYRLKSLEHKDGRFEAYYSYDEKDRISKIIRNYSGNLVETRYDYHDQDSLILEIINGQLFQIWYLNEHGLPFDVRENGSRGDGAYISYNNQQQVDTVQWYGSLGSYIQHTGVYEYENGRLSAYRFYKGEVKDLLAEILITYDENGNPKTYGDEQIIYLGNNIVQTVYNSPGYFMTSNYSYHPGHPFFYKQKVQSSNSFSSDEREVLFMYERGKGIFPLFFDSPENEAKGLPNFMNYSY
jgi:hypothetical protein